MIQPIYLDYNASTPHAPEVIEAMRPYFETEFGNPSSSHWYGIAPKQAVEKARQQVSELIGCSPEEIIFTSGGTESNNHALKSIAGSRYTNGTHIITSQIEHPAILEVCRFMENHGFSVTYLPVDKTGMVQLSDVAAAISSKTIIISIMHANNEVGTLQPIEEISALAAAHGIIMHTDAAQSLGKIETHVDSLGVGLMSIAGHKIYAPKGIGALYNRNNFSSDIFFHGAGQEKGLRAGTENVIGIVGLGKACEIASQSLLQNITHMKTLRDRLENALRTAIDDIHFNGHPEKRIPNTSSVSFLGLTANQILEEIGLEIAASAGAACHADNVQISHVLEAMKIPEVLAKGTIRFSIGKMTTESEIDRAADIIVKAVKRLRA